MDRQPDIAAVVGADRRPKGVDAAGSHVGFHQRDAVRLVFILALGSEEAGPDERVFRGEKRAMAIDFLVRYPDYLADELLNRFENEGDLDALISAEAIFAADEPDVRTVSTVFAKRGIGAEQLSAGAKDLLTLDAASETQRVASVEQALGSVSPALRDYTNDVLFGDVWRRPGLAPRDRSLVTISALITGGKTAQLVGHLNRALDNGLTKPEASGVITHLAFYAGWPNAMSAASVAKTVFEKRPG